MTILQDDYTTSAAKVTPLITCQHTGEFVADYTTFLLYYFTIIRLYCYTDVLLYCCTAILLHHYTTRLQDYSTTRLIYYYTSSAAHHGDEAGGGPPVCGRGMASSLFVCLFCKWPVPPPGELLPGHKKYTSFNGIERSSRIRSVY
jgi:hypothetical protein